jgi:hypothetical protein
MACISAVNVIAVLMPNKQTIDTDWNKHVGVESRVRRDAVTLFSRQPDRLA